MSVNQIGQLASGLLEYEFDYITGSNNRSSELTTISGSLSGKLGELNVVLNQSFTFTGDDGNPYPRLGQEEGDILQLLYMRDYNTKQAQKLLRGIYDATTDDSIVNANGDWIELSEGDTTIRRSPTALANSPSARMSTSKEFKEMAKEADAQIKDLVYRYNMYGAEPVQVAGNDAPDLEFTKDCVYMISLYGENGSQSVTSPEPPYKEGQHITITGTPFSGYAFSGWEPLSPTSLNISNNSFTMPAENVSITGIYV